MLDDANATTHRTCSPQLDRLGAHYLPERWSRRGKVIASAGVSAGMHMALQLVARLTNEQVSEQIQLPVEYDPQHPSGHRLGRRGQALAGLPGHQWINEGLVERPDLVVPKLSG